MPTENRSSNTEMVSVPRELTQMAADAIDDLLADGVSAVSAAAWIEIPKKLNALLAQPAEHQDGPVGYARKGNLRNLRLVAHCASIEMTGVPRGDDYVPLYTRADPGEVERLREHFDQVIESKALDYRLLKSENEGLRAQLTELEALCWGFIGSSGKKRAQYLEKLQAALSDSAEPEVKS